MMGEIKRKELTHMGTESRYLQTLIKDVRIILNLTVGN